MKDTIIQGLQQAYQNLFHMISDFLPRLVVMLAIVITGVIVAYVFKYLARMILRLTKLDRLSEEAGASKVLRMAALPSMTDLLSRSVFWITLLGSLLIGISELQIASLQEQTTRLLRLLPEIVVAMLILFLGLVIANFLSRAVLLASVNKGYGSARLFSWSIRIGIWILAVAMALDELSVARQTVLAAFSIVFGAFMLGLAIAFGFGGQELARKFLEQSLGPKKKDETDELQPL
jgi:hypothetical protein